MGSAGARSCGDRIGPASTVGERKRNVTQCIKDVAAHLGNTPAVCRSSYVHPVVLGAYDDGRLFSVPLPDEPSDGLGRSEHGLLTLLREADRATLVA
jgi:DNA topoisomerase-1